MKRILIGIAALSIFSLGLLSVGAVASKPPAPPGKDPCSHGNTGKPCRPDPQPDRGKDCEKHGKEGGVNEDHCKGETTPPTTTTDTTTTTTDKTTTQETTTSTSTTPATTSTSTTPPTTTPSVVSPVAPPTKAKPKGVTPKELEKELKKQAKKNGADKAGPAPTAVPGELPKTGLPLGTVALLGMGLAAGGLAMRRVR